MSPNTSFGTVKELAFNIGFADPVGIAPYAAVAVELDG